MELFQEDLPNPSLLARTNTDKSDLLSSASRLSQWLYVVFAKLHHSSVLVSTGTEVFGWFFFPFILSGMGNKELRKDRTRTADLIGQREIPNHITSCEKDLKTERSVQLLPRDWLGRGQ